MCSVECSCVLLSVYYTSVVLPPPLPRITCLLVWCTRCVLCFVLNKGSSRSRAVYGARELRHRLTWAPVSSCPHCSPRHIGVRSGICPAHAERDLSFTVEPMENDAPCAKGVQRPPVATTGRAGEPTAPWWQGQELGCRSSPG